MAPTVVFNYYGPLSVASKGTYPMCFIVTTLAMFLTAFSYANMSREFQKSGLAYVYVQKSLNPHLGFVAGWVMLLDYLLLADGVFPLRGSVHGAAHTDDPCVGLGYHCCSYLFHH